MESKLPARARAQRRAQRYRQLLALATTHPCPGPCTNDVIVEGGERLTKMTKGREVA